MTRAAYSEEVLASAMPVDLTVDPDIATNPQAPADWVELTGGGTLTYKDGSNKTQTLTSRAAGYILRVPQGFRKLVSLTGASPAQCMVGTGLGPIEAPSNGAPPAVALMAVDYTDFAGLAGGVKTHDYTFIAPAGARLLGLPVAESVTDFDDATHGTMSGVLGKTAGGNEFGTALNLAAGQSGFPKLMAAGANAILGTLIGGLTFTFRFTSSVDLNTLTTGHVAIRLPYYIAA